MNTLKTLRLDKGLSQYDLAKLVDVTPKYISFIENGERTPSLKVASAIAKVFEVSIEDIFLPLD